MVKRPSAEKIASFCDGCDGLQDDGSCYLDTGRIPPGGKRGPDYFDLVRVSLIDMVLPLIDPELPGAKRAKSALQRQAAMREAGFTKQEQRVASNFCDDASVQGTGGTMTKKGFKAEEE